MSGAYLPKHPDHFHAIPNSKITILGSLWHDQYITSMIECTKKHLIKCGVSEQSIQIIRVPGALELPFMARLLLHHTPNNIDAIIMFGIILQGETSHHTSVLQSVITGINELTRDYHIPIINEVIAVQSLDDAKKRSENNNDNKGIEAVYTTTELLHTMQELKLKFNP